MVAFQVCARCGTRWPVDGRAATWCPRCHGVLLSPVSPQAPVVGRRNFRWTARPPKNPASTTRRGPRPPTPTPRYDAIPRWGLLDVPRRSDEDDAVGSLERNARTAVALIGVTGALLLLAAAAELFRYGILLYNRTRLVDPIVLLVSDSLVLFAQVGALIIGLGAIVGASCWVVVQRRAAFADAGTVDPRSARWMIALTIIPVVRLVMPGVYLTELVTVRGGPSAPRLLRLVRIWWAAWVLSNVVVFFQILWRNPGSLQAKADGVLWAAFVALFGAAVAALTIVLMRRIENRTLRGGARTAPTRWVVAVGARPAVASGISDGGAPDSRAPDVQATDESDAPASETETDHAATDHAATHHPATDHPADDERKVTTA